MLRLFITDLTYTNKISAETHISHTFDIDAIFFYTVSKEVVNVTDKKRKIILSDFDHRLLVALLVDYRNKLLQESRSTEDINELLLKIIDSPKHRWWR